MNILETAKEAVEDREKKYGSPIHDFERQARSLSAKGYRFTDAYGGIRELTASDMAIIQIDVKMSRLCNEHTHNDSWVDIAGYADCGWKCVEKVITEESGIENANKNT